MLHTSIARRGIISLGIGAIVTVIIAWACALWMPTRSTFDPLYPLSSRNAVIETVDIYTVDPDGEIGLQYRETGFGWTYMFMRGERYLLAGKSEINWRDPWGGVYHQVAGWPLPSMWSRVEVLDSQGRGISWDHTKPEPIFQPVHVRHRWELPRSEIIHRGLASNDLPAWLHAQPDRRLALIPLAAGFAGDTAVYAIAYLLFAGICGVAWRRFRPSPRGFPVILKV